MGTLSPISTVMPPDILNHPVPPVSGLSDGELSDQLRSVSFDFDWQRGEVYSICARSRSFGVHLEGPDGHFNDNENVAGDVCSPIFEVPANGTYTVIVSSVDGTSTGDFSLEIISYNDCPGGPPFGRVTGNDAVQVLRSSSILRDEQIGTALPNECFGIIGRDAAREWWKIDTDDGRTGGWIAAREVETIGDTANVPESS
jgi:hypothetical protein